MNGVKADFLSIREVVDEGHGGSHSKSKFLIGKPASDMKVLLVTFVQYSSLVRLFKSLTKMSNALPRKDRDRY